MVHEFYSNKKVEVLEMSEAKGKTTPETPVVEEKSAQRKVSPKQDDDSPKFTKAQLLASSHYSHRRDALAAVLKDGAEYSHAEVDKKLTEFFQKGVQ